jgi:hypothetical protein
VRAAGLVQATFVAMVTQAHDTGAILIGGSTREFAADDGLAPSQKHRASSCKDIRLITAG